MRTAAIPAPIPFFLAAVLSVSAPAWVAATVGPIPVSDRDLAAAVGTVLDKDLTLNRLHLTVEANQGSITLRGRVPNLTLKREAVRLAAGQRGVLGIDDRIELTTGEPTDRTVELRVRSLLSPYADFQEPHLRVVVEAGRVVATGRVGTIGRRLFLDEILADVPGVRAIDLSGVTLETDARAPTDDKVLHDAILALLRNPLIFPVSGNIKVDVAAGEATLSGEVPRLIDRMETEFVAGLVAGAGNVRNELTINPRYGLTRIRDFSHTD